MHTIAWDAVQRGLDVRANCPCNNTWRLRFKFTHFERGGIHVTGHWSPIGADCPVCGDNTAPWQPPFGAASELHERGWFTTCEHECGDDAHYDICTVTEHYALDTSFAPYSFNRHHA